MFSSNSWSWMDLSQVMNTLTYSGFRIQKQLNSLCGQTSHCSVLSAILIGLRHQSCPDDGVIGAGYMEGNIGIPALCFLYRCCRVWTIFTLSAKSSTLTSSLRTSCCVWRRSSTNNQQGATAPPLFWVGRRPSPQALCFFLSLFFVQS